MTFWKILILAFSPGLFWLWFFYRKDKWEPEPKWQVAKSFLLGLLVAIPVSFLEHPFSANQFVLVVLAAPIIEEFAKYLMVRLTSFRTAQFNEPLDGIIYASAVALGFASIETVSYLFVFAHTSRIYTIFILRGLLSIPGHVLFSSMWGYALGLAKFAPPEVAKKLIRRGLALSMLLHALFNLLLGTPWAALGMLILVPLMWKMANRRIRQASLASPFVNPESSPATREPDN